MVKNVPETQQQLCDCEAVVEALVREHLTKKLYTSTLAAFKSEQPALLQPINKRSVLQELLGLNANHPEAVTASASASLNNPIHSSSNSSTLELWVQQHLHKQAPPADHGGTCCNSKLSSRHSSTSSDSNTHKPAGGFLVPVLDASPAGLSTKVTQHTLDAQGQMPPGTGTNSQPSHDILQDPQKQQQQQQPPLQSQLQPQLPQKQPQQHSWQRRLPAMQQQQQQHPEVNKQQCRILPAHTSRLQAPMTASNSQHSTSVGSSSSRVGGHGQPSADQPAAQLTKQVEELVICDVDLDGTDLDKEAAPEHNTQLHQHMHPMPVPPAAAHAVVACRLHNFTSSSSTYPAPWSAAGSSITSSTTGSASARLGGLSPAGTAACGCEPLSPEQQRQLLQLVWGGATAHPEAAWQQGLLWSETPGLEWGLVQLSGGPCGVLAAVQAHLIGTLMEQKLWQPAQPAATAHSSVRLSSSSSSSSKPRQGGTPAATSAALTPEQLHDALTHSLTQMLWTCASGSSGSSGSCRAACVVLLPAEGPGSAGLRGLCDAAQLLRMLQVCSAHSAQELELLVRAALPQWNQRKAWGVLLLLYSALLSRGCDVVRADMDNSDTRLVDALGYCSMELVNLLLTGTAVSNVFDGNHCFGDAPDTAGGTADAAGAAGGMEEQLMIRGVGQRSRVGLLTLFEWYNYVEVGQHLKSPQLPVWVVCSESHFSVLALCHTSVCVTDTALQQQQQGLPSRQVDTAVLKPAAGSPLSLQYYDALAKQEGPIVLELRPAPGGQGWSSRMAGVCEERGVWQGRPIPSLECVLETKWPNSAFSWQGSDPIL